MYYGWKNREICSCKNTFKNKKVLPGTWPGALLCAKIPTRSAESAQILFLIDARLPSPTNPTIMSYSYQGFYSREKLFFVQMAVCPLISVFSREKKKLCPVGWHLASSFHP
uniref:Uncharacterized protein n=1 Tax=Cacopsylla melanoneura TaxID=428564 RepID=A0A8D8YWP9_9HEMI